MCVYVMTMTCGRLPSKTMTYVAIDIRGFGSVSGQPPAEGSKSHQRELPFYGNIGKMERLPRPDELREQLLNLIEGTQDFSRCLANLMRLSQSSW